MDIQFGYDISYQFPSPTAVVLLLHLRPELTPRLMGPEAFRLFPEVPFADFVDTYGNRCIRFTAPEGLVEISSQGVIHDNGLPPPTVRDASEFLVSSLPGEVLPYLLPSRYCDLELLGTTAWSLFGNHTPGWSRVEAICDWVHSHLSFDERQARSPKTASQAFQDRLGVDRDYTHLAISLCRSLNIPARYATGYLADLGPGGDPIPMDFAAWMEVYLGGIWHLFDVRHNSRRVGHLPMARGRDAADVAFMTSFGPHALTHFEVYAREAESLVYSVAS